MVGTDTLRGLPAGSDRSRKLQVRVLNWLRLHCPAATTYTPIWLVANVQSRMTSRRPAVATEKVSKSRTFWGTAPLPWKSTVCVQGGKVVVVVVTGVGVLLLHAGSTSRP